MNESGDNSMDSATDAVEELLSRASPRPAPPAEDERRVRDAVRAEWRAATGKRRLRRRVMSFAAAAIVVLALAVTINTIRIGNIEAIQVASVNKSFGSIYILGDKSELEQMRDLAVVSAGETIVTGSESGIGLIWQNGGSLRIDQDTRIEFLSTDKIRLGSGRVYFDSRPSELVEAISAGSVEGAAASTGFQIETPHGLVRHLGTQYMTYADSERLSVSVREGQVSVESARFSDTAVEGQELTLAGSRRPSVVNISGYGESWQWVEATSPAANLDGRSVHEFLTWVSRETGLELDFDSDAALQLAQTAELRGVVDTEPSAALLLYEGSVDLEWRIDGGYLHVRGIDTGSGR